MPSGRLEPSMYRLTLAVALTAVTTTGALPQEVAKSPSESNPQLHEFARNNPHCAAFYNQCQTCIRASDQRIHCSNHGIACIPQAWTCNQQEPEKR